MRYVTLIVSVHDTDSAPALQNTLREALVIPEAQDEGPGYTASLAAAKAEQSIRRLFEVDDRINASKRRA